MCARIRTYIAYIGSWTGPAPRLTRPGMSKPGVPGYNPIDWSPLSLGDTAGNLRDHNHYHFQSRSDRIADLVADPAPGYPETVYLPYQVGSEPIRLLALGPRPLALLTAQAVRARLKKITSFGHAPLTVRV